MKKTANYGLNLWEKADRIQMEDFNADNTKLDSALKALSETSRYVLLQNIITSKELAQVDVDLTGIDWSTYPQIMLLMKCEGTSSNSGRVLFNGSSEKHYRYYNTSGNATDATCAGNYNLDYNSSHYFNRITITGASSIPQCDIEVGGTAKRTSYFYTGGSSTGVALNAVNFVTNGGNIKKGATITIYGVKF